MQEECHTVMAVPGLPTAVALLSNNFVFIRDFTTHHWEAGAPGCWTVDLRGSSTGTCAFPGVVRVHTQPPTTTQLRLVPPVCSLLHCSSFKRKRKSLCTFRKNLFVFFSFQSFLLYLNLLRRPLAVT
jgi:hypothetical protein